MANHKSAKTRIKRNNKRAVINGARRSRVRTFVKKVIAAVMENNKEAAQAAFAVAESELMRAAQKGVVEKHNASRTVSRLSKKIKALQFSLFSDIFKHKPTYPFKLKGDFGLCFFVRKMTESGRLCKKALSRNLIAMFLKCSVVIIFSGR